MNVPSPSGPRVSVIMPVYGTAQYVPEALDSVLRQTYMDYEIIVVNDGSPDSELLDKVIAPYRDRITYIVQQNRGSSAARNTALQIARGEYVAMLDSDDYWNPEYLASQLALLDAEPSIDVVYPDAIRFGPDGKRERRFSEEYPAAGEITFSRVLAGECHVYGGVTARLASIMKAGLYDEKLTSGEDFDLWLRILKSGGRIAYNDRVLAYYRQRTGSLTANEGLLTGNMLKVLDGLEQNMDLTAGERTVLDRQRSAVVAKLNFSEGKQAFLAGDRATAIGKLIAASKHARSWKLWVAIVALRLAPGLLLRLYRMRERWEKKR